jgi:uncharacterized protein (TIGR02466 family)
MPSEFDLAGRTSWPTMFFYRRWLDHAAEAPGILEFLYGLRGAAKSGVASGVAPTAKSAQGIYESDFDLFKRDHSGLRKLVSWIQQTIAQAACVANGSRAKPEQVVVDVDDAWFHITNDGGFHDAHYHPGCSWCGMYYLQAGDVTGTGPAGPGNGVSRFYSPIGTGAQHGDFGNAYLSSNRVDITPTDGTLLLFPAYLLHSGLPYRGGRDRVVIAFNSSSHLKS